jgi:IS30 family transposase
MPVSGRNGRHFSRPTTRTVVHEIERLRRQRWTGKQIAAEAGVSPATVSRVLRRLGLNKLSALEPAEPVRRYERETPGELIHIDIKAHLRPPRRRTIGRSLR